MSADEPAFPAMMLKPTWMLRNAMIYFALSFSSTVTIDRTVSLPNQIQESG